MATSDERSDVLTRPCHPQADARRDGMVFIPGGVFAMGSNRHYPEEAPVHRVSVESFWIDETPVTNAQFRNFVDATGYVTFAEIPPKAEDYPGACRICLRRGRSFSILPESRSV